MSNMTDLWPSGVLFQALNIPKLVFRRGSATDPAREFIYDAPPDLVGWGGGQPLPIPFPPRRLQRLVLGAFGASLVRSRTHIPGYAHDRVGAHVAPTHRPDLFKESNKYKLGNCMVADVCIY